jgi:hypothetical protein
LKTFKKSYSLLPEWKDKFKVSAHIWASNS